MTSKQLVGICRRCQMMRKKDEMEIFVGDPFVYIPARGSDKAFHFHTKCWLEYRDVFMRLLQIDSKSPEQDLNKNCFQFWLLINMFKTIVNKNLEVLLDEKPAFWDNYHWYAINKKTRKYIRGEHKKTGQRVMLHRELLGLVRGDGKIVDHINRNVLDNRLSNLRLVSYLQNSQNKGISKHNTSGYKGVCWHKLGKRWTARIRSGNKNFYLGLFDDKKEAAKAYNRASLWYFGDFASLNEV